MRDSSKMSGTPAATEPLVSFQERGTDGGHEDVRLVDMIVVLLQEKKLILAVTAAALVLSTAVAFLLPKTYTATSVILPPEEKASSANLLLGQIGLLGGLSGADLGLKDSQDLFVAMLKSRSIEDGIIDKFDLRKTYGVRFYQDARKKLDSRSKIVGEDEGLISISVSDRDPARAADMANAYVDELRSLNQNLAISEASQRRLFYEQKVDAERDSLSVAELALKQAQEKTGLLQPDAQAKVIIQSVADMRAQVATREVQIQAMRTYATKDNPELVRAEQELAGMRAQLAKMERNSATSGSGDFDISTRKLPQAELEYLRRARDLKYHEALYEFLGKQLEAARIDEGKQAVVVQVVDKAVTPEKKSGPPRLLIILCTTLVGCALASLWVLCVAAFRRKRDDPDGRARVALLRHSIRWHA